MEITKNFELEKDAQRPRGEKRFKQHVVIQSDENAGEHTRNRTGLKSADGSAAAIITKASTSAEIDKHVDKLLRETEFIANGSFRPSDVSKEMAQCSRPSLKAKANFYRTALTGGDVRKAYEGLGALPAGTADLGNGDRLLPTNMSSELLLEPLEENSLRRIELTSQIKGLEEHKLLFEIEDADLTDVTDQETAKEIKLEGDTISYGRFKTKITATIKDTAMHGSDYDLVTAVENALRSGLAIKEKINAFRSTSDTTHDHMSFYLNGIKEVEGPNLIQAIINAWADLPDAFSSVATCVMRRVDYYSAIRQMANSDTLWGEKPEDIIGIPVEFNDRATTPIVGDFRYARQNYDIGTIFETDKDGKKGEYYFILTAWGDHRIRLKSAFRLAKVSENT